MSKRRAVAALVVFTQAIALLQVGGASKLVAKYQPLTNSDWFQSGSVAIKPSKEEELLKSILPLVTFDCKGKTGYFPDLKFDCEVFHYCKPDGTRNTFHCPAKSLFNQLSLVCEEKTTTNTRLCIEGSISSKKNDGRSTRRKSALTRAPSSKPIQINVPSVSRSNVRPTVEKDSFISQPNYKSSKDKFTNTTADPMNVVMTLEDLLSYMNGDYSIKNSIRNPYKEPSFVSSFNQPAGDSYGKTLVSTSITKIPKEIKNSNSKLESTKSIKAPVMNNTMSKIKPTDSSPVKKNVSTTQKIRKPDQETTESLQKTRNTVASRDNNSTNILSGQEKRRSLEFKDQHDNFYPVEASIQVKTRQHRRRGRVLDLEQSASESIGQRHTGHSHISVRSPTESPLFEDVSSSSTDSIEAHLQGQQESTNRNSSKPPSLFNTDRHRAKDYRKRRRNQRRRKSQNLSTTEVPGDSSTVYSERDPTTEDLRIKEPTESTLPRRSWKRAVLRQNSSARIIVRERNVRKIASRKTSHTTKESSSEDPSVRQGLSHSENLSAPYLLPSLLEPPDGTTAKPRTGKSNAGKSKVDNITKDSNRNPWFKVSTKTAEDDDRTRYGVRKTGVTQESYYGDENGTAGPTDFFGGKEVSEESIELSSEENYRHEERAKYKTALKESDRHSGKNSKSQRPPKLTEEHESRLWVEDDSEVDGRQKAASQLFPPPRLPITSSPKRTRLTTHSHKSSQDNDQIEATSEDSFRSTTPYKGHYYPDVHELAEIEDKRWKVSDDRGITQRKKIKVGSSFENSQENLEDATTTVSPNAVMDSYKPQTSTIPFNGMSNYKNKEAPKQTAAHQQLSKLMNEFFAMGSTHSPGIAKFNTKDMQNDKDTFIPKYRIPDEDIYGDANLPPELLDVVEFISENSNKKNTESKYDTHEIVKVDASMSEFIGAQLEKMLNDDNSKELNQKRGNSPTIMKGTIKKLVLLPDEKEDDLKDIAELASFTSHRLGPLLKSMLGEEKTVRVVPLTKGTHRPRPRPQATAAPNKIPVRVIYRDQIKSAVDSRPQNTRTERPNFKVIRSRIPRPNLQVIHNGRMVPAPNSPMVVIHPPSLTPPHPPPLPPKPLHPPPRINPPHRSLMSPLTRPFGYFTRRHKRSTNSRSKRQIRQTANYNPFANPFFQPFTPTFMPHFGQFRNIIGSASGGLLNAASTNRFPFAFPTLRMPKLHGRRPFIPRQPIQHVPRQPIQHIPQTSHQTVIVEEVPVPIPVEVSDSLLRQIQQGRYPRPQPTPVLHHRPLHPGIRQPPPPPLPPPQIRRPPLFGPPQVYQNVQLGTSPPLRPPLNSRPPISNPRPPSRYPPRFSQPVPNPIRKPQPSFGIPVTQVPFTIPAYRPGISVPNSAPRPQIPRYIPSNGQKPKPLPLRPQVHSYTSSPYLPGGITQQLTQLANDEPSILMHSGYKAPKTTKPTSNPSPSRKPKPKTQTNSGYLGVTSAKISTGVAKAPKPGSMFVASEASRPQQLSYRSKERYQSPFPPKPNLQDVSGESSESGPNQSLGSSNSSEERKVKKKRPGRRRRPRPQGERNATPSSIPVSSGISPTPPPPEQIPPPPADFTTGPFQQNIKDLSNTIQSSAEVKTKDVQNLFPPAGYYGRDQLGQFFDSSGKKETQKSFGKSTPRPYQQKDLGEGSSSVYSPDSSSSEDFVSNEDGSEPAFGTRLRGNIQPRPKSNSRRYTSPTPSSTQMSEVRIQMVGKEPSNESRKRLKPSSNRKEQDKTGDPRAPPRRRKVVRPRPPPRNHQQLKPQHDPSEAIFYRPGEPPMNFFNVPTGLQGFVAPSTPLQSGGHVTRDMFGIPIPFMNQDMFSLRPQAAQHEFNQGFFSVPPHIAQQQIAPLQKESGNPIMGPFFTQTETGSPPKSSADSPPNPDQAPKNREKKRKLPSSGGEQRHQNTESNTKPRFRPTQSYHKKEKINQANNQEDASNEQEQSVEETTEPRLKDKTTIPPATARPQYKPSTPSYQYETTKKYSTDSRRPQNLPRSLQEVSKSLLNGQLDIQKLNATISTSVSVSTRGNNTDSENPKRVFSSKNGGLSVVRKGPRQRKKIRVQKVPTTTLSSEETSSRENGISNKSDDKLQIATSILDIIKATSETDNKPNSTFLNETPTAFSSSKVTKTWILKPPQDDDKKKKDSR